MKEKQTILISACLLGDNCKYSGGNNYIGKEKEKRLKEKYKPIKICPECMGGLTTPRPASEIINDNKIVNNNNLDVTKEFKKGAKKSLDIAIENNVKLAILKKNSPSCGHGQIYDGTFSKTLKKGDGITAKLLLDNGIDILNEEQI